MNRRVLHLIRKNTQLRASFIKNQIINHIDYKPYVAYYENRESIVDGGFASPLPDNYPVYYLGDNLSVFDKILYKSLKKLGKKSVKNLDKVIQQIKPDIIHLHYGTDAGIYLPLLKKYDIPTVVSFYGYDSYSFPNKYLGFGRLFLDKNVFNIADIVIAMSEEMKKDLVRIGCLPKKIIIHYHGVPSTLSSLNHSYSKKNETINLFMLSYLDPVKGHIFVLKSILDIIAKNKRNFKLRIAGSGHYEDEIKRFVKNNALQKYVQFLGPIRYLSNEFIKEFENADVFLHPSVITKNDKEGIPGALVEAMFAGLPIISTYHGGIKYVIDSGSTGLLVDEWDIKGLSSSILLLMSDSNLRKKLGNAAREYAMKNLSIDKKEKNLEKIYNNLID